MRCPYNSFKECIVQECPSFNYEEHKHTRTAGRYTGRLQQALERGAAWEESCTEYKFISCNLVEQGVQPVQPEVNNINTSFRPNIVVRNRII
mgnify:CR=1 FL=1